MKLAILVLEDEPEVRDALMHDLSAFMPTARIEPAEDVEDAWEVIREIQTDGDRLALALCDHRLPGTTGVDFLVEMARMPHTTLTRKVLVTGQADLEDTVRAINKAQLDRYIAKPWNADELLSVTRTQLTDYVEACGLNPIDYMKILDSERALDLVQGASHAD
ncbi:MAG: response regulator [Ancrocorticia sp.]|uniref:response regulator n=1 Tax=Ancrocorticia sp. TaxID=2593684 RepID=UPI003F8E30E5